MIENKFRFTIGSDLDYEKLIAVIGYDYELVAILDQEEGFENLRIKIYPSKYEDYWEFEYQDFFQVITKAKERLGR